MNNWIRKYNQNRRVIWTVIGIVAFFVIALQVIFGLIRETRDRQRQEQINYIYSQQQNTQNGNENSLNLGNNGNQNNGNNTNASDTQTVEQFIQQFVDYCNDNQIEQAYNMLSSDCKEAVFPTIDNFQNNYVEEIFTTDRSVKIEDSMYGNSIYKMTYFSDVLANGGYQSENTFQDYCYITEEGDETRLSINQFIRTEMINKNTTGSSIYANVIQKQIYVDYEIYQIQITNQSNNTILLSTKQTDNLHIIDDNDVTYSSNIDEIAIERLIMQPQTTSIFNIRFNKIYNTERRINRLNISNIITDYEKYQRGEEVSTVNLSIIF